MRKPQGSASRERRPIRRDDQAQSTPDPLIRTRSDHESADHAIPDSVHGDRARPTNIESESLVGIAPSGLIGLLEHPRAIPSIYAFLVLLMTIFAIPPLVNDWLGLLNKDYDLWYWTGWFYRNGAAIYPTEKYRLFPFMYPPSCAVMLATANRLGRTGFMLALILINSIAWIASVRLSIAATGLRKPAAIALATLVPVLCVVPFIHDTYLLGQPNLLLLALMLGAAAWLRSGDEFKAGILVGIAAAIKAFPIMAVGYLIYRRKWKASAAVGATLVFLLLIAPLSYRTPKQTIDDLSLWTRGMVLKYDSGTIAQRPERCYSFKNQSLIALEHRLLRRVPADGESDPFWRVNLVRLDFNGVNAAILLSAMILGLFSLRAMPMFRPSSDRRSAAAEWGMTLMLILMFSPLSFNYFFVWLLYPLTYALASAIEAPAGSSDRKLWKSVFGVAVGLMTLSIAIPKIAQAYGNVLCATILLFAATGFDLIEKRRTRSKIAADESTRTESASTALQTIEA
jgi:hypothetical protein